jgi:hypothetical protein
MSVPAPVIAVANFGGYWVTIYLSHHHKRAWGRAKQKLTRDFRASGERVWLRGLVVVHGELT